MPPTDTMKPAFEPKALRRPALSAMTTWPLGRRSSLIYVSWPHPPWNWVTQLSPRVSGRAALAKVSSVTSPFFWPLVNSVQVENTSVPA